MINKHEAIRRLYPQVVVIRGDVAFDENESIVQYDEAAVESYAASQTYKQLRMTEYPPIGDQLDALFHAGVFPAEMAAKIQAVKDKYPKV